MGGLGFVPCFDSQLRNALNRFSAVPILTPFLSHNARSGDAAPHSHSTHVLSTILANGDFAKVIEHLPPGPKIVADLAHQLIEDDVGIDHLTNTLRGDVPLARGVIAAANSEVYVGAEPIVSLEDAVVRLGQRETFHVAGAVAASQLAHEPLPLYAVAIESMRAHTLFTAVLAEQLADQTGVDSYLAFTAGLVRSVGKIVLNQTVCRTAEVSFDLSDVHALSDWELEMIGYRNNELGADILEAWGFPDNLINAVREHYTPPVTAHGLTLLLNIAAGAAHDLELGFPGERDYWQYADSHLSAIGLNHSHLQSAVQKARRHFDRLSAATT